ncbi:MAG: signal peptide peptidase SppA [Pirellulaceae bacterium]|nr:signal peptide peptidase SppA [Pirellulaceae bacterium]
MTPAMPPQTIVVYQQGLLSRLFGWLGWLGFFGCLAIILGMSITLSEYFDTTEGIEEKFVSGNSSLGADKVAILSIEGVILEGDGFVKRQIDRIAQDDKVKAIVVRVDSPGGTVTGSDYMLHHLDKLRKEKGIPLVVSMGSIAASGGYYVSMAVGDQKEVIFAEPTTTTGSIGVIIPHYDLSGLMARFDVKDDSIASHERKQMLSMTKPISDEHRALIQHQIDQMFGRFKSIIKEGRPVFKGDEAALDKLATGEVFSADDAKKYGLVDRIGFIEDAIDRAIELAKLNKDETRVVKFKRPTSLLDLYGGATAKAQPAGELLQLLEFSAPRAWYLATSLPAIATSRRAD